MQRLGDPRVAAVTAHRRALSQPSPTQRSGKSPTLTAPRHPPYCSPPLPRGPRGERVRPGGAGLKVNGRRAEPGRRGGASGKRVRERGGAGLQGERRNRALRRKKLSRRGGEGEQRVETGQLGKKRGGASTRGVASGDEREGRERLVKLVEQREATGKLAA